MTRRTCSTPACPNPATTGGRCSACRRTNDNTRKVGTIYRTQRWRRLRLAVLEAEPQCRECQAQATTVDHIIAIEDGGPPWDRHNLQALCTPCHSSKTALEISRRRGVALLENTPPDTGGQ